MPIVWRPELDIGTATVRFVQPSGGYPSDAFVVSSDGERIAMVENIAPSVPVTHLEIVINWHEELKRLVSTDR